MPNEKKVNEWPAWPDARGWIGLGIFAISTMLLWMMRDPDLRSDQFFQTIATVIISNGLMAVVAWAYAATKGGGELAEKNASIVETAATVAPLVGKNETPQDVRVINKPKDPVPTEVTNGDGKPELPEYAR